MALPSRSGSFDSLIQETFLPEQEQTLACKFKRHVFKVFKEGPREALEDLKSFKSKEGGLYMLFSVWLSGLLVVLSLLAVISSGFGGLSNEGCNPDDTFTPFANNDYSYFSGSGFFQVTLAFGSLTFTKAKVCDIMWDIVSHCCYKHAIFNADM